MQKCTRVLLYLPGAYMSTGQHVLRAGKYGTNQHLRNEAANYEFQIQ